MKGKDLVKWVEKWDKSRFNWSRSAELAERYKVSRGPIWVLGVKDDDCPWQSLHQIQCTLYIVTYSPKNLHPPMKWERLSPFYRCRNGNLETLSNLPRDISFKKRWNHDSGAWIHLTPKFSITLWSQRWRRSLMSDGCVNWGAIGLLLDILDFLLFSFLLLLIVRHLLFLSFL